MQTIDRQPAAVVRAEVPLDEIRSVFDRGFREVMRVTEAQGIAITGPPSGFYPRMPSDTVEVAVGFPVSTAVTPDGEVSPFELPGGQVVTGMRVGPYESLEVSDPSAHPDPATWQTKITWPLARSDATRSGLGPGKPTPEETQPSL